MRVAICCTGWDAFAVAAVLEVGAGAAVEADKADEVAVKVADREAGGVADEAALHLDSAEALAADIAGEDVVAARMDDFMYSPCKLMGTTR